MNTTKPTISLPFSLIFLAVGSLIIALPAPASSSGRANRRSRSRSPDQRAGSRSPSPDPRSGDDAHSNVDEDNVSSSQQRQQFLGMTALRILGSECGLVCDHETDRKKLQAAILEQSGFPDIMSFYEWMMKQRQDASILAANASSSSMSSTPSSSSSPSSSTSSSSSPAPSSSSSASSSSSSSRRSPSPKRRQSRSRSRSRSRHRSRRHSRSSSSDREDDRYHRRRRSSSRSRSRSHGRSRSRSPSPEQLVDPDVLGPSYHRLPSATVKKLLEGKFINIDSLVRQKRSNYDEAGKTVAVVGDLTISSTSSRTKRTVNDPLTWYEAMFSSVFPALLRLANQSTSLDECKSRIQTVARYSNFSLAATTYFRQYIFNDAKNYLESHREQATRSSTFDISTPNVLNLNKLSSLPTNQSSSSSSTKSSDRSNDRQSKRSLNNHTDCGKFNSREGCTFGDKCKYPHVCRECQSSEHGKAKCPMFLKKSKQRK